MDELFAELMEYKKMVEPYVCDVSLYLWNALKEGKEVLLEGQLGSLKDPDHGIYPMVTSSSTLAAYGAIGAGIPPYEIKQIVTVCKAYSSAVGAGAFVSEIFGDEADELRRRGGDGGEFGATTGRPRRMGWFDCVASKYGCRLQGTTDVAFTVLDVLGYLDEIPVCVGYEIDGEVTTDFPTTAKLEKAKPVLKNLPGWKCDIRGIRKYEDLPENFQKIRRCAPHIETYQRPPTLTLGSTFHTGGHNITDHTLSASCTDCYSLDLPIQITVNPHIRKMIAFFYIFSKLTKSHNMGKLSYSSEPLRLLPGSIGNCKHPCILKLQMICA